MFWGGKRGVIFIIFYQDHLDLLFDDDDDDDRGRTQELTGS